MLLFSFLLTAVALLADPSEILEPSIAFKIFPPYRGTASWYSRSDEGVRRHTASGEVFDDRQATCASWNFPFGTRLKITNVRNGKSVICRVNDRGPRLSLNRSIDLTRSSFEKIADPKTGLIEVTIFPVPSFGV